MKIHIVKQGDTLFEIAKKYGVSLEQLKAANPQIADPDQIAVGQKVKIPAASGSAPTPPVEYKHKHTVSQGDTLWKISKAWEVPLQALINANPHLKNPSVLLSGDTVYIPKDSGSGFQGGHAGWSASIGKKAATSPKAELLKPKATEQKPVEAPQPAPAPPVVEKPIEKPIEKPVEKPVEKAAEKVAEKVTEKVAEKVAEKAVEKAAEKPAFPNAISPVTEKSSTPQFQSPNTIGNMAPENVLPLAMKPEQPAANQPISNNVNPFMPMVEAAQTAKHAPCPPWPEQPYGGYPMPPLPVFPQATAGAQDLQHPFWQMPVPAVEAMAMYPSGQEPCDPAADWANQPYPGLGNNAPPAVSPMAQTMPWGQDDCGCGGGTIPGLPYAIQDPAAAPGWGPSVQPWGNPAAVSPWASVGVPGPVWPEFPAAQGPWAMQPGAGYGWPQQPCPEPVNPWAMQPYGWQQPCPEPMNPWAMQPAAANAPWMEQPGVNNAPWAMQPSGYYPCHEAAVHSMPTVATPYANPYAFAVDSASNLPVNAAPHTEAIAVEPMAQAVKGAPVAGRTKPTLKKTIAKRPQQTKSYSNAKAAASDPEPKGSQPWINF